jgi:DNA replication protein DnaC
LKLGLLVLDKRGYIPASKVGAVLLFEMISTAHERTSIILTTNLPFENWTEVLGLEWLTGARLRPIYPLLPYYRDDGVSYRLKDARTAAGKEHIQ